MKRRGAKRRKAGARRRARSAPAAPARPPEVGAWLRREVREQEARYRKIVAEMETLAPQRERWIAEFYERIQTRGFNVHADVRRRVRPEEIPPPPRRKLRVVF